MATDSTQLLASSVMVGFTPRPGKSFNAAITPNAIALSIHRSTNGRLVLQSFAIDVMVWFSMYFSKIVERITSRCGNVLLFDIRVNFDFSSSETFIFDLWLTLMVYCQRYKK